MMGASKKKAPLKKHEKLEASFNKLTVSKRVRLSAKTKDPDAGSAGSGDAAPEKKSLSDLFPGCDLPGMGIDEGEMIEQFEDEFMNRLRRRIEFREH